MDSPPRGNCRDSRHLGYAIVNEDLETCKQLTSGAAVVTEVDLQPVAEEQSIDVAAGELTLGRLGRSMGWTHK
jgi:hypothetical protein